MLGVVPGVTFWLVGEDELDEESDEYRAHKAHRGISVEMRSGLRRRKASREFDMFFEEGGGVEAQTQ